MKKALLLAVFFAACSTSQTSADTGTEGGACYANDTCNAGLSCLSHLCVNASGNAGADGGGEAASDAASDSAADAASDSPVDAADDAAEAAGDAGPFTPASLGGLTLWLVSDQGVVYADAGGFFAKWTDQSHAHHDATPIAQPPTVVASAFGAKPGINLTGATVAVGALNFGTLPVTVEIVAQGISSNSIFTSGTAPSLALGATAGNASAAVTGGSPITTTTNTSIATGAHLLAVQLDGAGNLNVRVDGTAAGTASGTEPNLGVAGTYLANATVAEVVAVIGTLTPAQLSDLETYLRTKYSL